MTGAPVAVVPVDKDRLWSVATVFRGVLKVNAGMTTESVARLEQYIVSLVRSLDRVEDNALGCYLSAPKDINVHSPLCILPFLQDVGKTSFWSYEIENAAALVAKANCHRCRLYFEPRMSVAHWK